MNITIALYQLRDRKLMFKTPRKVLLETKGCYYTEGGGRYRKSKMNTATLSLGSGLPFIFVVMVDASRETLTEKISEWFREREAEIMTRNN